MNGVGNIPVNIIKCDTSIKNSRNIKKGDESNFKNILKTSKKEEGSSVFTDKTKQDKETENINKNVNKRCDDSSTDTCRKKDDAEKKVYEEILSILNNMSSVMLDGKDENKLINLIKNNCNEFKNIIVNSLKDQGFNAEIANEISSNVVNKLVTMLENGNTKTLFDLKAYTARDNILIKDLNSRNSADDLVKKIIDVLKVKSINNNNVTEELTVSVNNNKGNLLLNLSEKDSEGFLRGIIEEDKKNSNVNKAINFMNLFKSIESRETNSIQDANNIVINKNTFVEDIIKSVKFMNDNGLKNLSVKIMPKELGEIVIKVTMDSGVMKAQISASNKETFNLLNANMQNISDKINSSEIRIENISINLNNDDANFFNQQFSNGRENKQKGKDSISTVEMDASNIEIPDKNVEYYQGNVNAFV